MNKKLPDGPPQERRVISAPARFALLLLLPAAGLGLLVPFSVGKFRALSATIAPLNPDASRASAPSLSLNEILAHPDIIPTHHHPLLGQKAPAIELADPEGKVWKLEELQAGRPLVLIFYYGYHCPGCVRQLVEIDRDLPLFRELDARVVAISADPPELTRQRFQEHGPLGFLVLSDPGNKMAKAYQVFRADLLRHGTFIIDRDGTVQWVNVGDAPFRHNSPLLYQLAELRGAGP